FTDTETLIDEAVNALEPYRLHSQDALVFTAGVPFGSSGLTNLVLSRRPRSKSRFRGRLLLQL
ncbi:MAG: hypothetical protein ACWGPN_05635, partial [Gammaproteobacteria bacterium]